MGGTHGGTHPKGLSKVHTQGTLHPQQAHYRIATAIVQRKGSPLPLA